MVTRECGRSPDRLPWDGPQRWARRWGQMILFVGLATIAGGPAMAQNKDTAEYDTGRTLEYLGNECLGVQDCLTIKSPNRTRVSAGQSVSIVTQCPSTHPHIIGWDTRQSEHVAAHLGRPAVQSALTLLVTNNTDTPGFIRVFLGCAEQIRGTTAFRQYRGGNPSNLNSSTVKGLR